MPGRPGEGPPLLPEVALHQELGQGHVEHPVDLGRAPGPATVGPGRVATTGVIRVLDDTVGREPRRPTTVGSAGSRPTSSHASRRAACSTVSPGSSFPPGKATSPRWARRAVERTVRRTRAPSPVAPSGSGSPSGSSNRATRVAARRFGDVGGEVGAQASVGPLEAPAGAAHRG